MRLRAPAAVGDPRGLRLPLPPLAAAARARLPPHPADDVGLLRPGLARALRPDGLRRPDLARPGGLLRDRRLRLGLPLDEGPRGRGRPSLRPAPRLARPPGPVEPTPTARPCSRSRPGSPASAPYSSPPSSPPSSGRRSSGSRATTSRWRPSASASSSRR